MHGNNDGYATGSKDGTVILWDNNFKPITKLEMINTPVGYEGDLRSLVLSHICVMTTDCLLTDTSHKWTPLLSRHSALVPATCDQ